VVIRARFDTRYHEWCYQSERRDLFNRIDHEKIPPRYIVTMLVCVVTVAQKI